MSGGAFLLLLPACPLRAATVTIDGSQKFQTIDGFGVNLNHWNTNEIAPVLDALVDQAGMTLFRVIRDHTDWEATNTNSDLNVTNWVPNWAYYNRVFSTSDFQTQWDMMAYLNRKGITNGISLSFMGLGPTWMLENSSGSTYLIQGYEPYWAEMLTALLLYARNTCHLQFNLVEPNNEPDNPGALNKIRVTQSQQVIALRDLAQCLDANGLADIRFVGPDLAFTSFTWLSAWLNDPVIMGKLGSFGIHGYLGQAGGSTGVASFLQQSAYPDSTFWMTEYNAWCTTCEGGSGGNNSWGFARDGASYLLDHLANGAAGAMLFTGCDTWMAYLNAGAGGWSYWGLFGVDNINAVPKTFSPRKGFYAHSQITKYVRPGAQRIGLSGSTLPFNLLAFYHSGSGQLTLVGVNSSTGANTLSGSMVSLPPVSGFDFSYTSSSVNTNPAGRVPVSGGTFTVTIPGDCVFTLVSQPGILVALTNPSDGATFRSPATLSLQATASTSAGTVTDVAFYAGGTQLGDLYAPPYVLAWDSVPPGVYTLTAWATNSLGNAAVSSPVHVTVVGPPAQVLVSPTNVLVPPNGTQQFAASVTDALGSQISPQPAVLWSVSGGGSIAPNGLFSAGGSPGGPFSVVASSGSLSGSAVVTIATNGTLLLPYQPPRSVTALSRLTVTNTAIADLFVTGLVTNSFSFNYADRAALLADGWSFLATLNGAPRNTEVTNPANGALVIYNLAGPLTIPCDVGDLWGPPPSPSNNTRNSLFRSLPTHWLRLQLAFSFSPNADYEQAHLALYQDDDNYLELGLGYNSSRGVGFTLTQETAGSPSTLASSLASPATAYLRFDRALPDGAVTGLDSTNGTNWNVLLTTTPSLLNPRLAIWTGGAPSAYTTGMPVMAVRSLAMISSNTVPRTLTYTLLNPPSGATIDSNGIITWQPTLAQAPSTNILTTVVMDNSSPPARFTNSFTVVVLPFPAFHILSVSASNQLLQVSWESEVGRTYRVQYKNDLTATSWQALPPDVVATGATTTVSNLDGSGASRLYRIELVP